MTRNITSADHINAAIEAIAHLAGEYETLDGKVDVAARGRRATAMERLCAVTFTTVTDDLDPYGLDDLNDQLVQETLEWSLFVTDLMVAGMLDFREKARKHHHRPESYLPRLRDTLLDIWISALEELQRDPDEAGDEASSQDRDQESDSDGDDGDDGDAGEWGSLAA